MLRDLDLENYNHPIVKKLAEDLIEELNIDTSNIVETVGDIIDEHTNWNGHGLDTISENSEKIDNLEAKLEELEGELEDLKEELEKFKEDQLIEITLLTGLFEKQNEPIWYRLWQWIKS